MSITERTEERIVLHNIGWRTYESLLRDVEPVRSDRRARGLAVARRDATDIRLSHALPPLTADQISEWMQARRAKSRILWLRQIRDWAKDNTLDETIE